MAPPRIAPRSAESVESIWRLPSFVARSLCRPQYLNEASRPEGPARTISSHGCWLCYELWTIAFLLASNESKKIRIEDIRMCGQHAMRVAGISLQRPVLKQVDRTRHRTRKWNDLVSFAVHDQHRHGDLLEVFGIIFEPRVDS